MKVSSAKLLAKAAQPSRKPAAANDNIRARPGLLTPPILKSAIELRNKPAALAIFIQASSDEVPS